MSLDLKDFVKSESIRREYIEAYNYIYLDYSINNTLSEIKYSLFITKYLMYIYRLL